MNKSVKILLLLLFDLISTGISLTFETLIYEKVPSNNYFSGPLDINLKIAKFENKTIKVLSGIIMSTMGIILLIKYIKICKNPNENSIEGYGCINLIYGIKNFVCLILSIAVLSQVKKAKKNNENNSFDLIQKESKKLIMIEVFAIIFYIGNIFLYGFIVSKLDFKNHQYIIGESDRTNQYKEIKQYIDVSIYEALIKGIFDKRAEEHLIQIFKFYKNQQFDDLCDDDNIKKEMINVILFIVAVLHYQKDELMIHLSKDIEKNFSILFEYSLPLILIVIKLKIEKGYYKKSYVVVTTIETQFFVTMEREIERNDEGDITNYKHVFRCRKVSNETIQVLRTKL